MGLGLTRDGDDSGVCPPAVDEAEAPAESRTREDADGIQRGTKERMEVAMPWTGSRCGEGAWSERLCDGELQACRFPAPKIRTWALGGGQGLGECKRGFSGLGMDESRWKSQEDVADGGAPAGNSRSLEA